MGGIRTVWPHGVACLCADCEALSLTRLQAARRRFDAWKGTKMALGEHSFIREQPPEPTPEPPGLVMVSANDLRLALDHVMPGAMTAQARDALDRLRRSAEDPVTAQLSAHDLALQYASGEGGSVETGAP